MPIIKHNLSPRARRVLQAILYEGLAISAVVPAVAYLFDHPLDSTIVLSVIMSTIALIWNYLFNAIYECWESKQISKDRTLTRRLAHGIGFEGGLALILIPLMAYWLKVSLWDALVADLAIVAFFFVYTMAFTWAFDQVFGLPDSAKQQDCTS